MGSFTSTPEESGALSRLKDPKAMQSINQESFNTSRGKPGEEELRKIGLELMIELRNHR